MDEIIAFLKENPVQFLATVGLDTKPKVRPFQFMPVEQGRLWFCTSNQKEVYAELQRNPFVELTAASKENVWLRLSGKAVFEENPAVKSSIIEYSPLVKGLYKSPDNPDFAVFTLTDCRAALCDFSGKPPREYTF